MGCKTCKQKTSAGQMIVDSETNQSEPKKMNRILGFLLFLLTLIFVPFSIPIMIGVLFNHFVIQNGMSATPLLKKIKQREH